jgi:chromosome partitioning protein
MLTLSVFNHAGGVGKTAVVRDLSYLLARSGQRVLVIDADQQATLTQSLAVPPDVIRRTGTLRTALEHGGAPPHTDTKYGMRIVPSDCDDLVATETTLQRATMPERRLADALQALKDDFDYVLIDCPPGLSKITQTVLVASDYVIVPITTSSKASEGIRSVLTRIEMARTHNPALRIALFIVTLHDGRTSAQQRLLSAFHEALPTFAPVSSTLAYRPGIYDRASDSATPVPALAPNDIATKELEIVRDELMNAINARGGKR